MKPSAIFVSYSQNFEDVLIYRALRHVSSGFYIDIGGWDPDRDSVTKAFYMRGWSGINVEPVEECFKKFKKRRRRDINLNCMVDVFNGAQEFTIVMDSGLSSHKNGVEALATKHGLKTKRCVVATRTLSSIVQEYCPGRHVDFVKIDVEGSELSVVQSVDWEVFRPTLVIVESIDPDSREHNFDVWEPYLLKARYRCVWFDGLNRYYLRDEDNHLKVHFSAPVSILDDFTLHPRSSMVPGWKHLLFMLWEYVRRLNGS